MSADSPLKYFNIKNLGREMREVVFEISQGYITVGFYVDGKTAGKEETGDAEERVKTGAVFLSC